jgi:hypothetical protein
MTGSHPQALDLVKAHLAIVLARELGQPRLHILDSTLGKAGARHRSGPGGQRLLTSRLAGRGWPIRRLVPSRRARGPVRGLHTPAHARAQRAIA